MSLWLSGNQSGLRLRNVTRVSLKTSLLCFRMTAHRNKQTICRTVPDWLQSFLWKINRTAQHMESWVAHKDTALLLSPLIGLNQILMIAAISFGAHSIVIMDGRAIEIRCSSSRLCVCKEDFWVWKSVTWAQDLFTLNIGILEGESVQVLVSHKPNRSFLSLEKEKIEINSQLDGECQSA